MPKLKVLSGLQVRAILEANGFIFVRQRGSHMMLQPTVGGPTVPVPKHKEIAHGTLRDIIAQSRLPRSLFENLS